MSDVAVDEVKRRVDIARVISRYVKLSKNGKSELKGLCPFHDDGNPSLTVNPEKGLFHCFSCGAGGDVFDFIQKIENVSFGEALRQMAEETGVRIDLEGEGGRLLLASNWNTRTPVGRGLTLAQYSAAKSIPMSLLQDLGLSDISYMGAPAVRIPYMATDRTVRSVRFRVALGGEDRFRWRSGDKALPYGLWRLDRAREAGYVVLVEGESDCHTLWYHDVPALGLPGAGTWREEWAGHFDGIDKIYIVVEPDAGGKGVLRWLEHSRIRDRALLVSLGEAKDPSGLYLSSPREFPERWHEAVESSAPWRDADQAIRDKNAQEAYVLAREALHDGHLLERVGSYMRERGYAGDPTPPPLVYLAMTSRLLERPVNLALVAPSAAGKNRAIDAALELIPPESVHVEKAGSARALVYSEESFEHRVIVMAEVDSIPNEGSAASAVRSIAEDNRMTYDVVEKDPKTGQFRTRRLTKPGPTGLITTSTRSVSHQLGTRMLEVPMRDDPEQTRAVLRAHARSVLPHTEATPNAEPLLAVQRWLEHGGERRVAIPFAETLSELVPAKAVRMRRDFRQLLMCIEAVTLLYQCQRERTPEGAVVATIEDYVVARSLLASIFQAITSEGLTEAIRETVEAVPVDGEATVTDLAERLSLAKSTISYRVGRAIHGGWLINEETRKGHPARLRRGGEMPEDADVLPTPQKLREVFERLSQTATTSSLEVNSQSLPAKPSGLFDCSTRLAGNAVPPPPGKRGEDTSQDEVHCKVCGDRCPRWLMDRSGRCPDCAEQDLVLFPEAR